MNAEKLKRATELNIDIKEIKDQIENLEKSDRINDDLNLSTGYLRRKFIDFNLFKTITIAQLKELLQSKENEFLNL